MKSLRSSHTSRRRALAAPVAALAFSLAPGLAPFAQEGDGAPTQKPAAVKKEEKPTSRPTSRPAAETAETVETVELLAEDFDGAPAKETPATEAPEVDAAAIELAKAVMKAHGGMDGLRSVGQIAFDFIVEVEGKERVRRSHYWDPTTNEGAVVAKLETGEALVVHFDDIWSAETATSDTEFDNELTRGAVFERARRQFINDSYWLLAPLKLMDDGVTLKREPDVQFEGKTREALRLSFDGVGVTPDDQYVFYVDPATKLVVGWSYIGKGQEPSDFAWENHEKFGPLMLPITKRSLGGPATIRFEQIQIGANLIPAVAGSMSEEELAAMAEAANAAHAAAAFDLEQVERDLEELERKKAEADAAATPAAETPSPDADPATAP
jgi:hypothetical protein